MERAENLHSLFTQLDENGYSPIIHASPKTWNSYYTQKDHDFSEYTLWIADWKDRSTPDCLKIGKMQKKAMIIGIIVVKVK